MTRNDHYIIVGYSTLSSNTYGELISRGKPVKTIDRLISSLIAVSTRKTVRHKETAPATRWDALVLDLYCHGNAFGSAGTGFALVPLSPARAKGYPSAGTTVLLLYSA